MANRKKIINNLVEFVDLEMASVYLKLNSKVLNKIDEEQERVWSS